MEVSKVGLLERMAGGMDSIKGAAGSCFKSVSGAWNGVAVYSVDPLAEAVIVLASD
jgi:hypothetical protein